EVLVVVRAAEPAGGAEVGEGEAARRAGRDRVGLGRRGLGRGRRLLRRLLLGILKTAQELRDREVALVEVALPPRALLAEVELLLLLLHDLGQVDRRQVLVARLADHCRLRAPSPRERRPGSRHAFLDRATQLVSEDPRSP